jgi:GDPmannose 4,6-dehydratase
VIGTSRDAEVSTFANLRRLGIRERVSVESVSPTDFRSVLQVLSKTGPDEVYSLAGQSSVALSFQLPVETLESVGLGTLNLLEAIRFLRKPIKLYNASSSECFGDVGDTPADERTPFRPRSPYAVAKATAFWEVANYREAYGLFACSGILFNHESPLRPERFVTKKIVAAAARIHLGSTERLRLGNLSVKRDWGWAPEYVEAMWRMLQQEIPDDFVIATGSSWPLEHFVEQSFAAVGLQWRDHAEVDASLLRPTDLAISRGNPEKAADRLGWRAEHSLPAIVRMMVAAEVEQLRASR